jgi:hypothetical protein
VEYVILLSEERNGLVYQLCCPRVAESVLDAGSETVEVPPVVVVRKPLADDQR